jgi:hypothetical protein
MAVRRNLGLNRNQNPPPILDKNKLFINSLGGGSYANAIFESNLVSDLDDSTY